MTEVQHQPERKTRPAGLLENIESLQAGHALSASDIFNLKKALKALGYYDGGMSKKGFMNRGINGDLEYAITLFQLDRRLIMTREDAQAGQWSEPLKNELVSVLARETDEAPEKTPKKPGKIATVSKEVKGQIKNAFGKVATWTTNHMPSWNNKKTSEKLVERIATKGTWKESEARAFLKEFGNYGDTAHELRDDVPYEKDLKDKYASDYFVDEAMKRPESKGGMHALKVMMDVYGKKKVVKKIDELRSQYEKFLDDMGIRGSRFGRSRTWAAHDMGKQAYYAFDPEGKVKHHESQIGKPYNNFAEVYEVGDAMAEKRLQDEILQRHVAWEIHNYITAEAYKKRKTIEETVELLCNRGEIFLRENQKQIVKDFFREIENIGRYYNPPSYLLQRFGKKMMQDGRSAP